MGRGGRGEGGEGGGFRRIWRFELERGRGGGRREREEGRGMKWGAGRARGEW